MYILLTRFRYVALWLYGKLGYAYHWLIKGWRPPLFWLIVTAFGIWLAEKLAVRFNLFNLKAGTWFQLLNILALYAFFALLWYAWKAGKRVVVEEFVDYISDPSKSGAKGLATLLVISLAQLRDLYHAVNEQRTIPTAAWVNHSIDVTINVEDVTGFLKGAISAESKLSLGPIVLPVGTLMSLIVRLIQGPRIIGSLHKDNDKNLLILTAQRVGKMKAYSWRVDRPIIQLPEKGEQELFKLDDMVTELAYRIFADLELKGSVRWKALSAFSEGLRAYRDCLRTPKDRKLNLKQTERKLIETLAEDNEFELAYYNLGVLYTELGQIEAAEVAFLEAIKQNPGSWQAYYALMVCHFQLSQYEAVIKLADRVIALKPGSANMAKAFHWKGLAQRRLAPQRHPKDLKPIINSRKKSVSKSWKALYTGEFTGHAVADIENGATSYSQLKTLAGVCLIDLAVAYSSQAKLYGNEANKCARLKRWVLLRRRSQAFRRAKALFRQALFLSPTDANHHLEFGEMYFAWEKYVQAVQQYEAAVQIQPDNAEFWACLALAYAKQDNKEAAQHACAKALDSPSQVSEDAIKKIAGAFEILGDAEQRERVAGMKAFLKAVEKDSQSEGAISLLEAKRKQYDSAGREWEYAQLAIALGRLYLKSQPNDALRYFGLAMSRLEKNHLHLQEIKVQELRALVARSLLDQKYYGLALKRAEEALSLDPLSFYVRDVLGLVYFKLNEFEHAINAWQEALLQAPDRPDIYLQIGLSYVKLASQYQELTRRTTSFQQAITYLKQALDLYKSDQQDKKGEACYFLGVLYSEWGEYEEAISYLRIAESLKYSPLSSKIYLGYALLKNKDHDQSIEQYQALLEDKGIQELDNDSKEIRSDSIPGEQMSLGVILVLAYCGLSFVYTEFDGILNLKKAMEYILKAEEHLKRLDQDHIKKVYSEMNCSEIKGWIYYKQGDFAEAINCLENAVTLSVEAQTYFHLALAYESKLKNSANQTELRLLLTRVRLYCQHVRELDVKKEYEQPIEDLLQRLKGYEQPIEDLLQRLKEYEQPLKDLLQNLSTKSDQNSDSSVGAS